MITTSFNTIRRSFITKCVSLYKLPQLLLYNMRRVLENAGEHTIWNYGTQVAVTRESWFVMI